MRMGHFFQLYKIDPIFSKQTPQQVLFCLDHLTVLNNM
jgi:hypothetical protein